MHLQFQVVLSQHFMRQLVVCGMYVNLRGQIGGTASFNLLISAGRALTRHARSAVSALKR